MYKSLEHIIREIKEGKCECEKKKDSLEGAIRKVQKKEYESSYAARDSKPVEEDIGGLIGSGTGGEQKLHAESGKKKKVESEVEDTKLPRDYGESIEEMNVVTNTGAQMMGRQFNTRSPLIGPPDVSQNSKGRQSAKNLTVQRMAKIQKFSNKNVSDHGKIGEEVVDEQAAVDLFKILPKLMPKGKVPLPFEVPKAGLPKIKPVEPEPILPEPPPFEPVKPGKDVPRPDQIPANEPGPAPKTKPEAPSEPAPKPTEKPSPAPEKAPKTKPGTVPAPAVEPAPEAAPAPKAKPVTVPEPVKDPLAVPAPKAKPVVVPSPAPSTATEPSPAPKGKPVPAPGKVPGIKLPFPYMPAAVAKPVELTGPHAPVATSVSRHRKHSPVVREDTQTRKSIQDMPRKDDGDRHNIEYVGRKDADAKSTAEKTSRQAQYKMKVIDEAKKLADVVKRVRKESGEGKTKVYDNVVINPDLNRPDNKNDAEFKP